MLAINEEVRAAPPPNEAVPAEKLRLWMREEERGEGRDVTKGWREGVVREPV